MNTTKYIDKNNKTILESKCIKCQICKCTNEYFLQELKTKIVDCKSCGILISFPTEYK